MSFAENLQTIRKNNQLSQEELAEMLGVSRQAVSKWELGEGYPEVEKLIILSNKLNVSLDSLMGGSIPKNEPQGSSRSGIIRIVSPKEGVIMDVSKVMRSQEFRGGKNSPKYALFASDGKDMSFWGAQNTFLAWYRDLDSVNREISEIMKALDEGVDYRIVGDLKNTDTIMNSSLWIGLYPGMGEAKLDYMVEAIRQFCRRNV